jgi:hypothetical protein
MKTLEKIFVVTIIALSFSIAVSAQKKDKRNVVDYYMMLPDNALEDEESKGKTIIRDIKNGYLKPEGAFEGYIEVALFRKKDGSALLLVGKTGCGPVCDTEINGYEMSGDELVEVTEKVIPFLSTEDGIDIYNRKKTAEDEDAEDAPVPLVYKLPRVGRIIRVKADTTFAPSDITLYELHFKNDKFVIVK